jgi:hypothetical protein
VLLTTNCRNSTPIADIAARFYPDRVPTPVVDGPPPEFHHVPAAEVLPETFRIVAHLTKVEGFQPNQLLVVPIGVPAHEVEQAARRAKVEVVAVDGIFRFPLTPKDLRVAWGRPDDVQGLEADATIVACLYSDQTPNTAREIYIATSRGRSLLHVISNLAEDKILSLGTQYEQPQQSAGSAVVEEAHDRDHH